MAPIALNGRVHSGPNCWTDSTDTYTTSYDDFRNGYLTKNGGTPTSLAGLAGNPFGMPVANDNHLALTVALDSDGYVYVAGGMHASVMRCIRFDTPGAVSGAFTDMAATLTVDSGEVYTYPTFASLSDGTLLLWIRRRVSGVNKWGVWRKPPGQAWAYGGTVLQDTASWLAYGTLTVTDDDTLRVGTWWSDAATELTKVDPGYIESVDAGVTWRNVSGTSVTLPLDYTGRSVQTTGFNPGGTYNDVVTATADENGRPAVCTPDLFNAATLIRWNGSAWATTAVGVAFTSRARVINFRGSLWVVGVIDQRVTARDINAAATYHYGHRVHPDFEPPVDPGALRAGLLRSGFVDPAGDAGPGTYGVRVAVNV